MKKVGFDIDGCIANFNKAFVEKAITITGKNLFPSEWSDPTKIAPPCWNYAQVYGYSVEDQDRIWHDIKTDCEFWTKLDPLPAIEVVYNYYINSLSDEIYFITSRPGTCVKLQTEVWLAEQAFLEPTVLISSKKGHIACGLDLDCYIDDNADNILAVEHMFPKCRAYLLDAPYNQEATPTLRVQSVEEFLREEKLI